MIRRTATGDVALPQYLTTREVARLLRLNEKKVYTLVAEGQLPAARISGKWLFPSALIKQWVAENTVYPTGGLLGALLDQMVVLQGSDDWLLARVLGVVQRKLGVAIPSSTVGSLAGLRALVGGQAHLAGCHLDSDTVRAALPSACPWYLLNLFERQQGLIYDSVHQPAVAQGLAAAAGLRFARRQPLSGTHKLTERLLAAEGLSLDIFTAGCQHDSHLELALAISRNLADVGIGAQVAAALCGLSFVPLHCERFQLALSGAYLGHPTMQRLLDCLLSQLQAAIQDAPPGYSFKDSGRLEPLTAQPDEPAP